MKAEVVIEIKEQELRLRLVPENDSDRMILEMAAYSSASCATPTPGGQLEINISMRH